jgi:hypothetical protein
VQEWTPPRQCAQGLPISTKIHLSEYYNVQIKGYVYINGYRMDQHELVTPQVRSEQLGIENTQFPELIKSALERVRAEVMYY